MNSIFVGTLLVVAALFFSIGWFLASVALSQSIRADLADLETERQMLDDEREMLTRFWAMEAEAGKLTYDLGAHRRLPEVLS
jgi:hypothetical protein